ncbi:unnamed protein product [Cuscuta epithymum]|uniref:Uncharacterized protein n=1 Tax=Cuscuta epithymum TaxID=186058 RepID=A0AAV0E8V7_9ASTE|nr:unnamed protein product [Cuscuta epithymum]
MDCPVWDWNWDQTGCESIPKGRWPKTSEDFTTSIPPISTYIAGAPRRHQLAFPAAKRIRRMEKQKTEERHAPCQKIRSATTSMAHAMDYSTRPPLYSLLKF